MAFLTASNQRQIHVFSAAVMVTWPSLLISRPDTIPIPATVLGEIEDGDIVFSVSKVVTEENPLGSLATGDCPPTVTVVDIGKTYEVSSTVW